MFKEYAKIALAIETCRNEIKGRKKLQKMLFIAKTLGYPLKEYFTLHLYGPYSQELTADVKWMEDMHIVEEKLIGNCYRIKLTENGKKFLERFQENIKEDMGEKNFKKTKNLLKKMSQYEAWELEIISTLLYFYNIGYTDFEKLQERVRKVKPKFSSEEIKNSVEDVKEFIKKFNTQQ
jgi:uncharacterized protein YwgA